MAKYRKNVGLIVFFCLLFFPASILRGENKKARELGELELSKYLIKCGESWYISGFVRGAIELRNKGTTYLKEKELTEADILNGLQFKGVLSFYYNGPEREYLRYKPEWSKWTQGTRIIDIIVLCENGEWSSKISGDYFRGGIYKKIT